MYVYVNLYSSIELLQWCLVHMLFFEFMVPDFSTEVFEAVLFPAALLVVGGGGSGP